ncbi:MAG: glutamine--fructose-6-phosphate transaminase (isomerizing), partial [Gaiellales bacterium]
AAWPQGSRSQVGIAHTRWATHGGVVERNAHPHTSCDGSVHVVLNGIVENYEHLRDELRRRGCRFTSDTDAEVVAHLVERHLARGAGLDVAVRRAYAAMRGHYAFAVMSRTHPASLVCARKECPLVIGVGEDETFVASAVSALPAGITRIVSVEDDEIITVCPSAVDITTATGRVVERASIEVTRDDTATGMSNHASFMAKEIHEQAAAVGRTVRAHLNGDGLSLDLSVDVERLREVRRIVMVGCGTSYHAGLVGRRLIERWAKLPVSVEVSSEWRYADPIVEPDHLVIGITQSGETRDTLAAMRLARELGVPVVALTNVAESQAAREAEATLFTHAGLEVGVAATKTFTTQVAALGLLALHLAEIRGTLDRGERENLMSELRRLPGLITETIAEARSVIADAASEWRDAEFFMYLGRDIAHPVAMEGALKMKEISYVPADAYPAGEMKHGPIALLSEGTPVVCVSSESAVFDKLVSNLAEVRARGAATLVVAPAGQHRVSAHADAVCWLPPVHPDLQPLLASVPLQLLALGIAEGRGLNVDQPRNLAKTVTVE